MLIVVIFNRNIDFRFLYDRKLEVQKASNAENTSRFTAGFNEVIGHFRQSPGNTDSSISLLNVHRRPGTAKRTFKTETNHSFPSKYTNPS